MDGDPEVSGGNCSYCGRSYSSTAWRGRAGACPCPYYVDATKYVINCGYEEGQEVRVTSDINDVASNEKLLSAEITF